MPINKKTILLFLALILVGFLIGKFFAHQGLRRALREEHDKLLLVNEQVNAEYHNKILSLSSQLHDEVYRNIAAKSAIEEIYAGVKTNPDKDSINRMTELLYKQYRPTNPIIPKVVDIERKQTWEQTVQDINAELFYCKNWFDSVSVLSSWLYQNTRVGELHLYKVEKAIGDFYDMSRFDMKFLYEVNNSDSVVGACGFHSNFALMLYNYYGIKSYCFSMRPKGDKSTDGHMFNVLENPHNHKWYPVDNFFGIRYLYKGEWLDISTYFQLAKQQQLCDVNIELFGTYKFHIQDSPFVKFNNWDMDNIEVVCAERSNYRNHFRIVAPYTLKKQFSRQFKALFDGIAKTYHQPPHTDWVDLARRMPQYGARLFSPLNHSEQAYADSLLSAWKK